MKASDPYFTVARDWLDHPAFGGRHPPYCKRLAWIWLLENARYQDGVATFMGQTVAVKRGDVCHATRYLARAWGWNEMAVRRYLILLESHSLLTRKTVAGQNVISICNCEGISDDSRKHVAGMSQECAENVAKKESGNQGIKEEHSSSAQRARARKARATVQPDLLKPNAEVVDFPTDDPREAMVIWNQAATRHGLSLVSLDSSLPSYRARRRLLVPFLRECGGIDGWRAVIERIPNNPWNLGVNPSGWTCSIDWLLRPGNAQKLGKGGVKAAGKHAYLDKILCTEPTDEAGAVSAAPDNPFDGVTIDHMEIAL